MADENDVKRLCKESSAYDGLSFFLPFSFFPMLCFPFLSSVAWSLKRATLVGARSQGKYMKIDGQKEAPAQSD